MHELIIFRVLEVGLIASCIFAFVFSDFKRKLKVTNTLNLSEKYSLSLETERKFIKHTLIAITSLITLTVTVHLMHQGFRAPLIIPLTVLLSVVATVTYSEKRDGIPSSLLSATPFITTLAYFCFKKFI